MSTQEEHIFSLVCLHCDGGMEVDSQHEAIELGWTHLTHDPDGLGWTWVGLCPDCQNMDA